MKKSRCLASSCRGAEHSSGAGVATASAPRLANRVSMPTAQCPVRLPSSHAAAPEHEAAPAAPSCPRDLVFVPPGSRELLSAAKLGRTVVGAEINQDYVDLVRGGEGVVGLRVVPVS